MGGRRGHADGVLGSTGGRGRGQSPRRGPRRPCWSGGACWLRATAPMVEVAVWKQWWLEEVLGVVRQVERPCAIAVSVVVGGLAAGFGGAAIWWSGWTGAGRAPGSRSVETVVRDRCRADRCRSGQREEVSRRGGWG